MTDPKQPLTLAEIAALDEASSKGPWRSGRDGGSVVRDEQRGDAISDGCRDFYGGMVVAETITPTNAAFVIAAKGFAPRLLADLLALAERWEETNDMACRLRDLKGRDDPYWRGVALAERQCIDALRALLGGASPGEAE